MKLVTITTDGACNPNPGNGGWAAVLRFGGAFREISGFAPATTNNRMEMTAVLEGLLALKEPCEVLVRSDAKLVVGLLNRTGLKPAKRKNQDLVQAILTAMAPHKIRAIWVKGHNGDTDNERCDMLADEQSRRPF